MLMKVRFVLLVITALLFPTPARAAATQEITFNPIGDRTLGQALTFDVAPTASSGLPVKLSADGACQVTKSTVTVLNNGTCTLTATQEGNTEWVPANPVLQTFKINRVFLLNKTVKILSNTGVPASGLSITWHTPDWRYTSTQAYKTDSSGLIKFPRIPSGEVVFEFSGNVGYWVSGPGPANPGIPEQKILVTSALTTAVIGPNFNSIEFRYRVLMEDGTPVPGAVVTLHNGEPSRGYWEGHCVDNPDTNGSDYDPVRNRFIGHWFLSTCIWNVVTDGDGFATLVLPANGFHTERQVQVKFTDGEIVQITPPTYLVLGLDVATLYVEVLPVVEIETDPVTINYGVSQTVTAVARSSDGSPIAGRSLTLSASVSGASASCSGRKTTATTNSSGRATFKVCPVKTATWSVDGRSIVGSKGVRLTVQLTPTAPRTLIATPKTRSVSLAWVAPVKANASSVTDYIVQYRLQGSSTWVTFRDGTSTARKTTVTSLTSGQVYEFRIAAKNKSGMGTWSNVVLGTPN